MTIQPTGGLSTLKSFASEVGKTMVAYSFQKRFGPPIKAHTKTGTIRGDRKRHARPGEMLQLYTGMRTKHCEKIIDDPVCTAVLPLVIERNRFGVIKAIEQAGTWITDLDAFAQADGFVSIKDMEGFWKQNHGVQYPLFSGFHILWDPAPLPMLEAA